MGGCTGAREDDDGLDAGFLGKRTGGMAYCVGLVESLALRLACSKVARLGLQSDTNHHLHGFDGVGPTRSLAAEHDSIGPVEDRVGNVTGFCTGRTRVRNH